MTRWFMYTLAIAMVQMAASSSFASSELTMIDVKRIHTGNPHAAFTDLIRFQDRFLCAFREGPAHASPDGVIRLMASQTGDDWTDAATLSLEGEDLRDPKLSIMPNGRLCLLGGAAFYDPSTAGATKPKELRNFVAFSDDGVTWTRPHIFSVGGQWVWRLTWVGDVGYAVAYTMPGSVTLLKTTNAIDYEVVVPSLLSEESPSEATIRFDAERVAHCLIRREGQQVDGKYTRVSALLGRSEPPYVEWTWQEVGAYLGGPDLLHITDDVWIAGGRTRQGPAQMSLATIDLRSAKLGPLLHLPSGGDCSYPGLVWHDGILHVSYYSSHEGASSIYFARVSVPAQVGATTDEQ